MKSKSQRIVTFDQVGVGDILVKRKKSLKVVEVLEDKIKIELEGVRGQVFTLTRDEVDKGKYSFL